MAANPNELSLTQTAVDAVLETNPEKVTAYHAGERAAFGFLFGRVMKMTGGLADTVTVNTLLRTRLEQGVS